MDSSHMRYIIQLAPVQYKGFVVHRRRITQTYALYLSVTSIIIF